MSHLDDEQGQTEHEEEMVNALLQALDHPPPPIDVGAVITRARVRERRRVRWAAGIVLALGVTGVAYAVPGSPLRHWVKAVGEWVDRRTMPAPRAPVPAQVADAPAGIAVSPGQAFAIMFTSPQANGYARVLLTDGPEIIARTLTGTAGFTSDVDRLTITNRDSSVVFEIHIPHAARWVEIRVDGERIFLKAGSRITTERPADVAGVYILPLKRAFR